MRAQSTVPRFALLSLIPAIILGWVLSGLVRKTVEQRVLSASLTTFERVARALDQPTPADPVSPVDHIADTPPANGALPISEAADSVLRRLQTDRLVYAMIATGQADGEAEVIDRSGRVRYATTRTRIDESVLFDGPQRRALLGSSTAMYVPSGDGGERDVRMVVPLRSDGEVLGLLDVRQHESYATGLIAEDLRLLYAVLIGGIGGLWLAMLPIARQVTSRLRRQAERDHRLAFEDGLTGLANRRSYIEHLHQTAEQARRRQERVGVLVIDVDDFKPINDEYGHAVGDHVLLTVGARIRAAVRTPDFSARVGGDEFAVVVPNVTDRRAMELVVRRISRAFQNPVQCDTVAIPVTVSIGAAVFPDDGANIDEVLVYADEVMYRNKRRRQARSHDGAEVIDLTGLTDRTTAGVVGELEPPASRRGLAANL